LGIFHRSTRYALGGFCRSGKSAIAASPSVYEELNGWLHWAAEMPTAVDVQPPTATCRRPNSDAHDQLHVYILGDLFPSLILAVLGIFHRSTRYALGGFCRSGKSAIAASPSVYEELNGWLHWAADMPTAVDVQPPTATCRRPNSDAHDQLHVYILGIFFLASF
ncbi:hypothetical protein J6590_097499, partial [Homalodisca vitripennis]